MSDKQDHWKELFEEDSPLGDSVPPEMGGAWDNPFETEEVSGTTWAEAFEEFSGGAEASNELGLDGLPGAEAADTFPLDETLFGSEAEFPQAISEEDEDAFPVAQAAEEDAASYLEPEEADDFEPLAEEDYDEDYEGDEDDYDYDDRQHRAIRRARRRRTGFLGGLMYAAFILGVSTILAFVVWMAADDVLGLTRPDMVVEIMVPADFTIEEVAEALYAGGAINNRWLFRQYAYMFGAYDRIQPGLYQVRPADYRAIIRSLNQRTGELTAIRVTITEGRTVRQIFDILEANGVANAEALMYAAENVAFDDFDFLADLPMSTMNRLEGFLFPDTYDFFLQQSPEAVIRTMLRNFRTRMNQEHNEMTVFELVEESPFTLREILNIASMIERETASIAEMPRISSVIWNRIDADMQLGIDATIQYLLPAPMEFLPRRVIQEHWYSPYNTYRIVGLPYGPIANPGMAAILAALQPESTTFLFYALHVDGDRHHFTRSYAEHNAFLNTPNFAHFGAFD